MGLREGSPAAPACSAHRTCWRSWWKVCLTLWHDTCSSPLAWTVWPECKTCWHANHGCRWAASACHGCRWAASACMAHVPPVPGHLSWGLDSSAGALSCQALLAEVLGACPCSICPSVPARLGQSQGVARCLLLFRMILPRGAAALQIVLPGKQDLRCVSCRTAQALACTLQVHDEPTAFSGSAQVARRLQSDCVQTHSVQTLHADPVPTAAGAGLQEPGQFSSGSDVSAVGTQGSASTASQLGPLAFQGIGREVGVES